MYWIDEKGIIRHATHAVSELLGYKLDELIGMTITQVNPEYSIKSYQNFFQSLSSQKTKSIKSSQITKEGKEVPVKIKSILVVEDGLSLCQSSIKFPEEKKPSQHTDLNELRWKASLEVLSEGVWDWDIKNKQIEYSRQWVNNFGHNANAKSYETRLKEIVHKDDLANVKKRLSEHLAGINDEYKSRYRLKDSKGNWRWVRDRGKVISRDEGGNPLRMIGTTQDVTDIIEIEKKLRLSQEKLLKNSNKSLEEVKDKFLNIFNHSNDAIFIGDPTKNIIVDVNPQACELLGYTKQELLGLHLSELIPNQKKNFIDFFNRVKRNKSAVTNKLVFKSREGHRIFASVSASVFSIDGETGILGILHTESEEGKFERVIGRVTEASIINPERGIVSNFMAETARVLRVQYAGMTRIVKEKPLTVKVLNFWSKNHFADSFEYEVKGSPCELVVGGDFHFFESGVKKLFPNAQLWQHLDAESYMAVPISDSKKNPIGHFFLCDDGLIERKNWIENLMRLGALRMRLEIERLEAQEALEVMNQNLEQIVKDRTKALTQANTDLEQAIKEVEELRDKLQEENVYLKEEIKLNHNFEDIISQDKGFKKVLNEVEKVANTNSTVLILGETGTGKEVITRSIHSISQRKDRPLVKVNCAALPATLIESELFGHEKGAYTGATSMKKGRFELANEGTLFLDEVGEIPLELQPKLLRALQEGEFERVGGVKTIKVDVRVIAATNRNLEESVEKGEFRSDLFYRLNVFPIHIPPLRDRKEDIPLLINHFIQKYNQKLGNEVTKVPQSVLKELMKYSWPGNVRELENIVERGVILSDGKNLKLGNWLKKEVGEDLEKGSFKSLEEYERAYIQKVLVHTNWKISGQNGAADILKMKPTTLESRMKKLGINRPH